MLYEATAPGAEGHLCEAPPPAAVPSTVPSYDLWALPVLLHLHLYPHAADKVSGALGSWDLGLSLKILAGFLPDVHWLP